MHTQYVWLLFGIAGSIVVLATSVGWLRRTLAARRNASRLRAHERDYLLRSVELTLRVSDRAWISQRLVEIESLRDGLTDYQVGLVPTGGTERVRPVMTGVEGDLFQEGDAAEGASYYVYRLRRPLGKGARARFNMQMAGPLEGRELLRRWSWSSPEPVDRVDLRLVFNEACSRPESVRYQVLDTDERSMGDESITCDDGDGEFRRSIANPEPRWTYQLRWD